MKGLFITFEGIDGSGKTTQIKLLADYLKKRGLDVIITREPGGTAIGDMIRGILLNPSNRGMSARAETFLFQASRAEIVEKVIEPAINQGHIVICDRFFDSTLAYQGIARGLGLNTLLDMSIWATKGIVPDLTFLLSVDIDASEKRMKAGMKKPDRIEYEETAFKEKIQKGYLELARDFKDRFCVIDGEQEIKAIFSLIKNKIEELL